MNVAAAPRHDPPPDPHVLGRLDAAEQCLDQVIALAPEDYDAYYNRSTLRRLTVERNHVSELQACLDSGNLPAKAQVPLGYALAKELEDLGEFRAAFAALRRAADCRPRSSAGGC